MTENNLQKITQKIKTILFNLQLMQNNKVYDYDVAIMLRIPPSTFTTMKSQMEFCFRNAIEINTVLYGTVVVDRVGG